MFDSIESEEVAGNSSSKAEATIEGGIDVKESGGLDPSPTAAEKEPDGNSSLDDDAVQSTEAQVAAVVSTDEYDDL